MLNRATILVITTSFFIHTRQRRKRTLSVKQICHLLPTGSRFRNINILLTFPGTSLGRDLNIQRAIATGDENAQIKPVIRWRNELSGVMTGSAEQNNAAYLVERAARAAECGHGLSTAWLDKRRLKAKFSSSGGQWPDQLKDG